MNYLKGVYSVACMLYNEHAYTGMLHQFMTTCALHMTIIDSLDSDGPSHAYTVFTVKIRHL